jgi:hypothetical protein
MDKVSVAKIKRMKFDRIDGVNKECFCEVQHGYLNVEKKRNGIQGLGPYIRP